MGTLKPNYLIKQSLTAFFEDVGNQFQVRQRDLHRNTQYVLQRLEYEGEGFVTKTLPMIGKLFDESLSIGKLLPMPCKTKRRGSLPLFLTGLIEHVFDPKLGTLLHTPDVDAIRLIRQLTYMFYKLERPYAQETVDECINSFVSVDQELTDHCDSRPELAGVIYTAQSVIREIFSGFDPRDIVPRPGPGAEAKGLTHDRRYEPHILYEKIHNVYPYYRYFYNGSNHLLDRRHNYMSIPRSKSSGISRLSVVPKDSRGPRLICMENHEYMWFQQGLGRAMMTHIEQHPFSRGQVNFSDQTINGKLALCGSRTGSWATLDMKEASDRISKDLVNSLFEDVPDLLARLQALSTDYIELPNGSILRTKKFAPMGSALCFPVMSIVHYALGIASVKMHYPRESIRAIAKGIFVYGDDIICRHRYVNALLEEFPLYGLKFNVKKSFYTGKFRESCGVDAYNGINVTPMRIKDDAFGKSAELIPKHLAYFHGFFARGLWNLAKLWRRHIENAYGNFPCVSTCSEALGWCIPRDQVTSANAGFKWSRRYQSYTLRVRVINQRPWASMNGGWERLLRQQVHCVEGNTSTLYPRYQARISWKALPLSGL